MENNHLNHDGILIVNTPCPDSTKQGFETLYSVRFIGLTCCTHQLGEVGRLVKMRTLLSVRPGFKSQTTLIQIYCNFLNTPRFAAFCIDDIMRHVSKTGFCPKDTFSKGLKYTGNLTGFF